MFSIVFSNEDSGEGGGDGRQVGPHLVLKLFVRRSLGDTRDVIHVEMCES